MIMEKIRREGPMSFHDFMEISLYWPGSGYYSSDPEKIGKSGDFYTSPYFSSLFGRLLARQFEEMWAVLGRQPFTIVEYGAGSGLLCRDILLCLRANKELYKQLRYVIIEKSHPMREKERALLSAAITDASPELGSPLEKVRWVDSIREVAPVNGCIFSNELLDNFSVHRVLMDKELMEIYVDYDGEFSETLRPARPELKNYLRELGVALPRGYRTEINLQALNWIRDIGVALNKGFVLTIDYGFPNSGLCYQHHTINDRPYDNIGQQDITAHVNFSALDHWGRLRGLQYGGFTTQANFLRGLGITNLLHEPSALPGTQQLSEREKVFLLHTFLLDMGQKFKVLLQYKGISRPWLSGFYFTEPLA